MTHAKSEARVYCTLFNSLYLVRGLALYTSLKRHATPFRLYVFAMDSDTANVIRSFEDPQVVVVEPSEFEDDALLLAKKSRTTAEYFWTCTPSIIRYCLVHRREPDCTYVDADVWLMADPKPIFDEMGAASVLLTEHRYAPKYDQSRTSGRFCVQFMRFTATKAGLTALEWWRARCIEWCYARIEDGKFGDQKYLDDWEVRFSDVHVLRNIGGGLAPWNIDQYDTRAKGGFVEVRQVGGAWHRVIFYHFHALRSYSRDSVCFGHGYSLSRSAKTSIYAPYVRELADHFRRIQPLLPTSNLANLGVAPGASNSGGTLGTILRRLAGMRNTYNLDGLPCDG